MMSPAKIYPPTLKLSHTGFGPILQTFIKSKQTVIRNKRVDEIKLWFWTTLLHVIISANIFISAYICRRGIGQKSDLGNWASSLSRARSTQIGETTTYRFLQSGNGLKASWDSCKACNIGSSHVGVGSHYFGAGWVHLLQRRARVEGNQ